MSSELTEFFEAFGNTAPVSNSGFEDVGTMQGEFGQWLEPCSLDADEVSRLFEGLI